MKFQKAAPAEIGAVAELYDADLLAEGALVICEDEKSGLHNDVMVEARYELKKEARYGRVYLTILTPITEKEGV